MLFSASIGSQDTLKVEGDRMLLVNINNDTVFLYGQESHFIIEKMFEEQDLFISEIVSQYQTIDEQLRRMAFSDSIYLNVLLQNESYKKQLELKNKRIESCENLVSVAEKEIDIKDNIIKNQDRKIRRMKVLSRFRTVLEGLAVIAGIYFAI